MIHIRNVVVHSMHNNLHRDHPVDGLSIIPSLLCLLHVIFQLFNHLLHAHSPQIPDSSSSSSFCHPHSSICLLLRLFLVFFSVSAQSSALSLSLSSPTSSSIFSPSPPPLSLISVPSPHLPSLISVPSPQLYSLICAPPLPYFLFRLLLWLLL